MLRLESVSKIYPTGEVLRDCTWEVLPGERIGLVGANGAGKSTQIKMLLGHEEPTSGQVVRPSHVKIAYLAQEFMVTPGRTVREELLSVFEEAQAVQHELNEANLALAEAGGASEAELTRLLKKIDRLQSHFEALDGYLLVSKVEKLLPELGFSDVDGDRAVETFSGGWQMRIGLGKLLLTEPDVLLLDEPTNHLDLETIEWLEGYLKDLNRAMVIVSHDRRFLDRIVTKIVEVERGVASTYSGNYSFYQTAKSERADAQLSAYERQQRELGRQQAFVDRFRASATRSTQAKSREKQLEKIERIEAPVGTERTLRFRFAPAPASGKQVMLVRDLSLEYGDKILFLGANLEILKGERIALLGPNGAGKSTLLRLFIGEEQPTTGKIEFGHNVLAGYYAQHQAETLDMGKIVLETLHDEAPQLTNEEVRTMLGRFLFSGDTVFKKVSALSGGEKSRLALARLLLRPSNFLLLDEPTNHLDIPSKEILEAALREYTGSAVIVSHDRYFIQRVATKIVEIREGELVAYDGDYDYYLDKKAEEAERQALEAKLAREQAKEKEKRAKEKEKQKQKAAQAKAAKQ
ncbi:ABC-F family ATP-binding cassette domain-containing protein [Gloeobacter morelensis]|uniref:ABC-F family ATP-binding cassette domain-containing protein n=1 Tax=Gloeobacter morelensis MG652769 TaxID=2781736 RepID=A0ABY3PPJ3_9CYAN|nr:ABC-F family ATP-binding cassette domain-containing protein [Gloeobacter morelensis]UFP95633.1 ABC-F family ATP-binding cassette domain-containing protein [Gloeobacter morelensis MG652769]